MATKNVKGLFKGLKYIGQIFEDEKEDEFHIGLPTDVKHVAHIGWDGGPTPDTSDANPSWMKGFQSGPLDSSAGNNVEKPEIKWVSEDSKKVKRSTAVPKSSRRSKSTDITNDLTSTESPKKRESTRSRHSRRNHSKECNETGQPGSPSRGHPDSEKRLRRKKPKDVEGGGAPTRPRSKDSESVLPSKPRPKSASSGDVPNH